MAGTGQDTLVLRDGPRDGVVTLTLDRPDRKNALSIALRDQLSTHLEALGRDHDTRVVVVTGAGSAFSAGFDLGEFASDDLEVTEAIWPSSDRLHHALLRFPLPTVAAVNGPALGGGFDLAVLCDVRVAARSARFAHPEHTFGDIVYGPLRELVGGAVARDLCLTGRPIDADEALRLRLVTQVVEDGALGACAAAVAAEIASAPRELLVRTKAKILAHVDVAPGTPTLDL